MSNLSWFSKWYAAQVCKSTDKPIIIDISTTENASWNIRIDLKHSKYSKISLKLLKKIKSNYNWFSIEIKDKQFIAEGDFTKLDFLIGKFREEIGEGQSKHYTNDDFFFIDDIQNFIFNEDEDSLVFLHYTNKKKVAEKIIKSGLEFTYAFDKTATRVKNTPVDLSYNHYIRKQFGDYVIVVCISKKLYLSYIDKIKKTSSSILRVEELLVEKPAYLNDESENVYTLNHKYIKGYFNYRNKELVKNPDFNPKFDSKKFIKNLKG